MVRKYSKGGLITRLIYIIICQVPISLALGIFLIMMGSPFLFLGIFGIAIGIIIPIVYYAVSLRSIEETKHRHRLAAIRKYRDDPNLLAKYLHDDKYTKKPTKKDLQSFVGLNSLLASIPALAAFSMYYYDELLDITGFNMKLWIVLLGFVLSGIVTGILTMDWYVGLITGAACAGVAGLLTIPFYAVFVFVSGKLATSFLTSVMITFGLLIGFGLVASLVSGIFGVISKSIVSFIRQKTKKAKAEPTLNDTK